MTETMRCVNYPHPWGEDPEELKDFEFMVLDPRPASREAMLSKLRSASSVYGIEVTIPEFAELCEVNLDHHGPNDTIYTPAACEQALTTAKLPKKGALIVTVRPDSDSVLAMSVLAWRALGREDHPSPRLVKLVSKVDRFGPFFPGDDRTELSKGMDKEYLSALGQVSAENQMSLAYRVRWAMDWVSCQMDDEHVFYLAEKSERELEEARQASELAVDGRIVTVVSKHRFATTLGYELADIVVALNPEMPVNFKDPEAETYRKFTVARRSRYVGLDMPRVLDELNSLEDVSDGLKWGGQENIIGSPQGRSSALSIEQVAEVVKRHIW